MQRRQWDELDLFRGFAALFMLLNHAGYAWLEPQVADGRALPGWLTFLGSFAPVLFFFATGVGYGLQSGAGRREGRGHDLLKKVGILVLCDQFSAWSRGLIVYFDFLSFIALSMLVLEIPRRMSRPTGLVIGSLLGAWALRFVGAPLLASSLAGSESLPWLMPVLGRDSVPVSSYPLLPWICFPLAGFLLGSFAQRFQPQLEAGIHRVAGGMIGLAALSFGAAWLLIGNDYVANRWGTMSISYFCLSVGVVASCVLLASRVERGGKWAHMAYGLSLRGISSLAVVPLHFMLVAIFAVVLGTLSSSIGFVLACALLIVIVFPASRAVAAAGNWLASASREPLAGPALLGVVALAGILLALQPTASFLTKVSVAGVAQLCLCMFFVVRLPGVAARSTS